MPPQLHIHPVVETSPNDAAHLSTTVTPPQALDLTVTLQINPHPLITPYPLSPTSRPSPVHLSTPSVIDLAFPHSPLHEAHSNHLDALAIVHTYFERLLSFRNGHGRDILTSKRHDERTTTSTLLVIHKLLRDLCPSLLETDPYAEALIDTATGSLQLHIFAGFVAPLLAWNNVQGVEGRSISDGNRIVLQIRDELLV